MKEDRRRRAVTMVYPMHLLCAGVGAIVEIDRQFQIVSKPVIARSRLSILTVGNNRRQQNRESKKREDILTTEDTEGFKREIQFSLLVFSVSSVVHLSLADDDTANHVTAHDIVYHVHATNHISKHSIAAVQVRLRRVRDEPL